MEPPPRPYGLGLYAGASLGSVVLGEDRMFAAQFDQENCFTYVEIPEWLQLYFAAPRLRHWEAGGPRVTGLHIFLSVLGLGRLIDAYRWDPH